MIFWYNVCFLCDIADVSSKTVLIFYSTFSVCVHLLCFHNFYYFCTLSLSRIIMQQNCFLNSLHSCFCPTFDDMFFLLDALKFAIYCIFTVVCKALLSFIQPVFFMHLNFIYVQFPVALDHVKISF